MLTTQLPVPEQAPLQPLKLLFDVGVAVNVTLVPLAKLALQVAPQSMPAGLLLTVPEPAPALATVSSSGKESKEKPAETVCAWLMPTVQSPVPLQAPLQPVKTLPTAGEAVSVTLVLAG